MNVRRALLLTLVVGVGCSDSARSGSDGGILSDGGGTADGGSPELTSGARTMIFSHVEYFCEGTETSDPYAYVELAFVESGTLKVVRTRTSCQDAPPQVDGRILGEHVTFTAPDTVTRADDSSYQVVLAAPSSVGYGLDKALLFVANADDAALITNDNPDDYMAECQKLDGSLEREVCLLWQIQLGVLDPSTCDSFTEVSSSLCVPYNG